MLLFLLTFALGLLISLLPRQPLLLLPLLHEHLRIILVLQVLQLPRLLLSLFNLLHGPHFLVLKHAHPVSQLLNIPLQLQPNRPSLIVGQVLAFDVNDDVGAHLARRGTFGGNTHVVFAGFLAREGVARDGAGLADGPRAVSADVTFGGGFGHIC